MTLDERTPDCLAGGGVMGAMMRAFDWARTPLGPVAAWPQSLRTAVSICLNSRYPILIWWGPKLIKLYNDAYRPMLGASKHPRALGAVGRDIWPEIWPIIEPMLEGVMARGEATWSDDRRLLLDRNGYLEECYFTFSYSPIRDESDDVGGIFTAVTETTERVLGERRLQTLRDLTARSSEARDVEEACRLAAKTLAANSHDMPFALLYLIDEGRKQARLTAGAGIEAGAPASPPLVELSTASALAWPLARVAESGQGELVEALRRKFASLPRGAWPEAPQSALLLPITLPGHPLPMALLVAAVSPRRALDEPYRDFYDRVAGQIAATLAGALACEEERKRADAGAAVRESEQRFARFMRHLPGLAWIKDLQGRYVYANEATEKAFCSPGESLYGKTDEELFPADTAAQFRENDRHALASPAGLLTEDAVEHKDGLLHHSLVSKFPILGCGGQPSFVGGMAIDISERKQMEQVLTEANRRKDEFLAMLAHELRNPLAPIRNAAQVLKLVGPLEPKQEWAREVIERQTQHLMRIVDDLLDVSRITRGRIVLRREPLELSAVINRAIETSRPLVEARRQQLSVSLPPQPVRLEGDLARLVQVVANLLNNAAKYTDEGGQIRLEAVREGDEAVIRVHDNGMGLPAELLPHVFDLFTQADGSLDRSQGGLGIGLTLVRHLVEMHDGKVEAKSDGPGRGSEFVVRLPALSANRTTAVDEPPGEHAQPARHTLKILLVEDNLDSAEGMALLLRFDGHEVRMAHDGPSALEAARAFEPQAVLLDLGLPGMNGYEVAQRLREQPACRQTPLIALTGYGQEEARRRTKEAGFDYHLVKPVEPEALGALLGSLRSARRQE